MRLPLHLVFVLAVVANAVPAFAQETVMEMEFEITLPGGAKPKHMVVEGGVATVNGPSASWSFWPTVRDKDEGLVRVIVRAGVNPEGRILDEVEVVVGEPAARVDTSPTFYVAVTQIAQR